MGQKKRQEKGRCDVTKERKKTGVVRQIVVAVILALLVGGSMPWWWNKVFGDNRPNSQSAVTEKEANELFSKYLRYVQEEDYEKIKSLYFDFHNCGSCQKDFENLKLFKGKKTKIVTKNFSSQTNSLKVKLEFETGNYYEPTFYLSKTKRISIFNFYETKIKEVLP